MKCPAEQPAWAQPLHLANCLASLLVKPVLPCPGLLCADVAHVQACDTILLAGPIQYDAAVDPVIAKQKIKGDSEVAGRANVLIFPDLNTGNNTYKVWL